MVPNIASIDAHLSVTRVCGGTPARNSNNHHRGLEPMTTFLNLTRVVIVSLTLAALSACGLGSSGPSGPSGTNGTNGTNGGSGTRGVTALVAVVAEPPGKNSPNGGNWID